MLKRRKVAHAKPAERAFGVCVQRELVQRYQQRWAAAHAPPASSASFHPCATCVSGVARVGAEAALQSWGIDRLEIRGSLFRWQTTVK